jgi:hypothetical protein
MKQSQLSSSGALFSLFMLAALGGNSAPASAQTLLDTEALDSTISAEVTTELSVSELTLAQNPNQASGSIDELEAFSISASEAALDAQVQETASATVTEEAVVMASTETEFAGVSPSAIALEPIADPSPMAQVTSVSQLSDVQPTDWYFQALQSLVERYGCIAGYPDGTYRGDRALTRGEFAAGLNACLDRVLEIVTVGGDIDPQDLATIRRLQEEFAAELATLRGRVDSLEARTSELEANQFSTTTKLFGQVVFGVQGRSDNEYRQFLDQIEDETQVNLIHNTQLSLYTQFGPRSLLLTGLQAGNGNTGGGGLSNYVGLGYEGDTDNDVVLSDLSFRQLFGDSFALILGPRGVNAVNVFRGTSRVEGAGFGPISRFAQRNPIINIGAGDGGVGFDWQLANRISLQGVYSTSDPASTSNGLFGGENGITNLGAQLVFTPFDSLDIAFQYVNSYSPFGRLFTGVGDDQVAVLNGVSFRAPIQTNAFGTSLEWRATPGITAGGWFGFTTSDLLGESGNVETINWMGYLNFPDLFGEGNLGGLYVGQPPRITNSDLPIGRNIPSFINGGDPAAPPGDQPDTTIHLEAFYRYRLTDNISITPGFITIFNPNQNNDNDTVFIGALRTTFTF